MRTKKKQTTKLPVMSVEFFPTPKDLLAFEKNLKCTVEGCSRTFVHNGALNMHLVKSHGIIKVHKKQV